MAVPGRGRFATLPCSQGPAGFSSCPQALYTQVRSRLVSCPAHAHLPVRNSLVNKVVFLGLTPQKVVTTNEIARLVNEIARLVNEIARSQNVLNVAR